MAENSNPVLKAIIEHPRSEHQWVGVEVERFAWDAKAQNFVRYEPEIRGVYEELKSRGWPVSYEVNGRILALERHYHSLSVEPGGQFEISPAPQKNLFELEKIESKLHLEVSQAQGAKNWKWLWMGMNPLEKVQDIPLLPSPRYRLMDAYFSGLAAKGEDYRGQEMMRLTCGLQINLDFRDAEEGLEMLKASYAISPYLSAVLSHSPYIQGKRSQFLSERHQVWRKTDYRRSRFFAFIFSDDFNLEAYAAYASKVPLMYAYQLDGSVFDPQGKSLCDFDSELQKKNAMAALRQIFAEVRYKPCCVELRGFDAVPPQLRYSASAFSMGLLYDSEERGRLLKDFKTKMTVERISELMNEGSKTGLASDEIHKVLKELLKAAERGLKRRGQKEEIFLRPIQSLVERRISPAELMLKTCGDDPKKALLSGKIFEHFENLEKLA